MSNSSHTEKFITNKSEGQERSRKVTGKKQGKGKGMGKEGARRGRKHRCEGGEGRRNLPGQGSSEPRLHEGQAEAQEDEEGGA